MPLLTFDIMNDNSPGKSLGKVDVYPELAEKKNFNVKLTMDIEKLISDRLPRDKMVFMI